ncbi:hypothetical protein L2719_06455 [Shewanella schlegeliana]|uniref:DUF6602 domain-containing protein n=1 Tax=Shewanella schlegeliana TaxID=190308 RepID=A0ABS1SXE9_9GAMM|nr:DUF6602 domain-containing protein [Shewanella schlegeliana]MBL4913230.1 hypothetical protein [Shewanella schlegeliana]MCL1109185.1 hypothetical protein [Shewanella schlegeliana]GIU24269.1 hypothetical protein TUM4433_07720 [Shewanella schlegeliana]
MTISQDFMSYQRSIGKSLKVEENRIRELIGKEHWLTDGEHKEQLLRDALDNVLPEVYRVGTGFVCYPSNETSSGQLDILITSKSSPTLYKKGALHFVTASSVRAIIEVKTKISKGKKLISVISKLSQQIKSIRATNPDCWAGLFIYDKGRLKGSDVLAVLQSVTANDPAGAINCVAIGENKFIRFWENGHRQSRLEQRPIWHSYELNSLAHSYFISNIIEQCSETIDDHRAQTLFPLRGEFGKEQLRSHYAFLGESSIAQFEAHS